MLCVCDGIWRVNNTFAVDNATDIRQSSVDLSLSTKLSTMVVDTLVDAVSRAPAFLAAHSALTLFIKVALNTGI